MIRRIDSFTAQGHESIAIGFRRDTGGLSLEMPAHFVDLGSLRHGQYWRRALAMLATIPRLWRARRLSSQARALYARNLDLAILAILYRLMSGRKIPLVYEVIDVLPSFLDQSLTGGTLRLLERLILRTARVLVVSSPAFVSRYFHPVQRYQGRWLLIENKLRRPELRLPSRGSNPSKVASLPIRPPWVIGYFGAFRCQRSLQILDELTRRLGARIQVSLRGYPSAVSEADFHALLRANKAFSYGGTYSSPEDLARFLSSIHIAWCLDFSVAGGNSEWLLPNRIYSAGAYRIPMIAQQGTETGAFVERHGMGWTFPEPVTNGLVEFLTNLSEHKYRQCVDRLAALPDDICVGDKDVRVVSDYLERL